MSPEQLQAYRVLPVITAIDVDSTVELSRALQRGGMRAVEITLRTDAETLDRLDKLAGSLDRSRNYLMNQALKSYLDEQAWQIEEIKAGLEELDRGEGVSAEEAEAIMDAFKKSKAT